MEAHNQEQTEKRSKLTAKHKKKSKSPPQRTKSGKKQKITVNSEKRNGTTQN